MNSARAARRRVTNNASRRERAKSAPRRRQIKSDRFGELRRIQLGLGALVHLIAAEQAEESLLIARAAFGGDRFARHLRADEQADAGAILARRAALNVSGLL